ncbi:hypothetical protein F5Y14DRAFT_455303 [Nemania sp. NC0429]|nr:hypothetical protein F5Y14DRAFT_455303 [Nemania sp. NC0429]
MSSTPEAIGQEALVAPAGEDHNHAKLIDGTNAILNDLLFQAKPEKRALASGSTEYYNSISGESDAISDTSFTPPNRLQLAQLARIDKYGRQHMVAPMGFTDATDDQKYQIVYDNPHNPYYPETPATPLFEKRRDFVKSAVKQGGIALAVALRRLQRATEAKSTRRIHFEVSVPPEKQHCTQPSQPRATDNTQETKSTRHVRFEVPAPPEKQHRTHSSQRTRHVRFDVSVPPGKQHRTHSSQPPTPRAADNTPDSPVTDQQVAVWSSPFQKAVFEAENDLLYDSRWPASTF